MALGFQQDVVAHTTRVSGGSQASLLVRLPAPLHAQLKAWSESNGYSMNTVVTGLLERFLRSQPPQSADG
jgi:predicted HicB family RNase H-like nuclease